MKIIPDFFMVAFFYFEYIVVILCQLKLVIDDKRIKNQASCGDDNLQPMVDAGNKIHSFTFLFEITSKREEFSMKINF